MCLAPSSCSVSSARLEDLSGGDDGEANDAGAESEEEYTDVPHGDGGVCYSTSSAEEPIRDSMSGGPLGRELVAMARQKELKYFLV